MQALQRFMVEAVESYCEEMTGLVGGGEYRLSQVPADLAEHSLDSTAAVLAASIGRAAVELDPIGASHWLSVTYTAMLPQTLRSQLGIHYTPPALSARLLDLASEAGADWATCRVLDPACGGGAFLTSAALRMVAAADVKKPALAIESLSKRLKGFEIDPFAAWLSQALLEVALADLCIRADTRLPSLVDVCDSLEREAAGEAFDLVIGNPPYGRIRLSPELRKRFSRSLYGHANLYGVFTDLALRWCSPDGVIAYVTPTSFLAGEYFKALRRLMASQAPPAAVDFIEARKGVFEDVLQETMLAVYCRDAGDRKAAVHHVTVSAEGDAQVFPAGRFELPAESSAPWLIPRHAGQSQLISRLAHMSCRISDWGYKISTGPLVWNRHKKQLRGAAGRGCLPLVWAEAIDGPGRFVFRAEKKNHQPFFELQEGDDWLRIDRSCVLLQRTTAKEQSRRLIAAVLPQELIDEHGGVVVENHLNMVRPLHASPEVSPLAVAAVLNSDIVDSAFRCISGSVAVSAYELSALPLPSVEEMRTIENLLTRKAGRRAIEQALRVIYLGNG
ncbi:MAG TPA: Eco57I restriction-modification methylase domain-containing protein [Acidobacteriota bacterium]|nr:Eco57I restriction-modification methylase domain-containing protein [Acidobacteriota bacterium]